MTIRTKDIYVPDEFPAARLFLDDVEEIVRILTQLVQSHKGFEAQSIDTIFSSGGKECDDITELFKLPRTSELRLTLKKDWLSTVFRFNRWHGTQWLASTFSKEELWPVYHKLETVFKRRKRHWTAWVRSLPWPLWIIVCTASPFVPIHISTHPLKFNLSPYPPLIAAVALFLVLGTAARHTSIVFRHSWEPSPVATYAREKVIPVVIGALLGIGGTLLVAYLKHKYWP